MAKEKSTKKISQEEETKALSILRDNKDKTLYNFSCVIVSAPNPDNLNESINIKNPYGFVTLEMALTKVRLALIACSNTPIVWIIFDIISKDEERFAKVVLFRDDIKNMDRIQILNYIEKNVIDKIQFGD